MNSRAKKIGKNIRLARIEKNFTQVGLSHALGMGQKSISRYETGLTIPTIETLEKIGSVLNKPVEYFFHDIILWK